MSFLIGTSRNMCTTFNDNRLSSFSVKIVALILFKFTFIILVAWKYSFVFSNVPKIHICNFSKRYCHVLQPNLSPSQRGWYSSLTYNVLSNSFISYSKSFNLVIYVTSSLITSRWEALYFYVSEINRRQITEIDTKSKRSMGVYFSRLMKISSCIWI